MKYCCLKCGHEVESDDNFCPECGHWTVQGYSFLKNQNNIKIINGSIVKGYDRLRSLFTTMVIFMIVFVIICFFRGTDIFKPIIYVKKVISNHQYGYNSTILKTDSQYFNEIISTKDDAKSFIKKDFSKQQWQCYNDTKVSIIEEAISKKYEIPSVIFCEMDLDKAKLIENVIDNIYSLFPNIKGYLTNITLANAKNSTEYVAFFQPIYQFANSTNNIEKYNKVNKTQILLNSYYFLNSDKSKDNIPKNWYVKDATYESLIAHEFGHYITFVSLLKSKDIDNIIFVTKDSLSQIEELLNIINKEIYSKELVELAINNYNNKYNTNIEVNDFAKNISNYAAALDSNGKIIYDEVIAESFHDYYLHKNNSSLSSLEIINILKSRIN